MNGTYYNEHDPNAAAWLFNLGEAGLIPAGHVDARDIQEVTPDELRGFTQAHFFCGIGGWPLAFRLAGVPPTQSVWSGSCPCQPYSTAGKRKGNADDRNLWPEFFRLIRQCRPDTIFGEQVESAIAHGWLDGISADLEGEGYAVGSAVLGAHSVGAPHIRQRLFWVADSGSSKCGRGAEPAREQRESLHAANRCKPRGLAEPESERGRTNPGAVRSGEAERLRGEERQDFGRTRKQARRFSDSGSTVGLANGDGQRLALGPEPLRIEEQSREQASRRPDVGGRGGPGQMDDAAGIGRPEQQRWTRAGEESHPSHPSPRLGPWSNFDLIPCLDGKARRIEPGSQCLVDGVSFRLADGRTREDASRAATLKGFGNAIVPELAAEFIRAYMEVGS